MDAKPIVERFPRAEKFQADDQAFSPAQLNYGRGLEPILADLRTSRGLSEVVFLPDLPLRSAGGHQDEDGELSGAKDKSLESARREAGVGMDPRNVHRLLRQIQENPNG